MAAKSADMSALRIGSLCTGYGGLDMAVAKVAGGRVVWNCDNDPGAQRILTHHHPDTPLYDDLTELDWASVEPIDILTAGYPCQPFSVAGQRNGTTDDRNIFPHIAVGVRVLRPRLCVFENVAGHLSLGFGTVLGELAALGYDARWGCVRASDVGAPHRRERLFIAAVDTGRIPGEQGGVAAPGEAGGGRSLGIHQRRRGERAPADAESLGHERHGRTRDRRHGPADGDLTPANTERDAQWSAKIGQPWRSDTAEPRPDRRTAPADAESLGRSQGRAGAARVERRPDLTLGGPASDTISGRRDGRTHDQIGESIERITPARNGAHAVWCALARLDWRQYGSAVKRWHDTFECVPNPTQPSTRTGNPQLAPTFTEWVMGVPRGHVTDVAIWEGMTAAAARNAQLKALGNGVCPPQAEAALRWLLPAHERSWAA